MARRLAVEDLEGLLGSYLAIQPGETQDSAKRQQLADRYHCEPYPEDSKLAEAGLSTVVDTSVRDQVHEALPFALKTLLSSDKICSFVPQGEEDEAAAEQETDVVNHVAVKQNNGFLWVYQACHDAFVKTNGYVHVYQEQLLRRTTERYHGVTEDELTQIIMDLEEKGAKTEIIESDDDEREVPDPVTGQPMMLPVLNVKLRIDQEPISRQRIDNLPPEEVQVAHRHASILLDNSPFTSWKPQKTASDLVAMGFREADVEDLKDTGSTLGQATEKQGRLAAGHQQGTTFETVPDHGAMTLKGYAKSWIRADLDGDGVAELLCVHSGHDGKVLRWSDRMKKTVDSVRWPYAIEEVEFCGIVPVTSLPVPHRHMGQALGEWLMQDNRTLTVMIRQMLDNLALNNNPRIAIDVESVASGPGGTGTMHSLEQSAKPGSIVPFSRSRNGVGPVYLAVPDMVTQSLAAIEHVRAHREEAGVPRIQVGLDENALNKTWRGQQANRDAASEKLMLIVRNIAEITIKRVMEIIHALLRKHSTGELEIKLRGQWLKIDPRTWRERTDMSVEVGLGTGNKEQQLASLANLFQIQQQLMPMGACGPNEIHNTVAEIVTASGMRHPSRFIIDPMVREWQPAPAPQDPMVEIKRIEAEATIARMDVEREKNAAGHQKAEAELNIKLAELELKERELAIKEMEIRGMLGLKAAEVQTKRDLGEVGTVVKFADLEQRQQQHDAGRVDSHVQRVEQRYDGERSATRETEERQKDREHQKAMGALGRATKK